MGPKSYNNVMNDTVKKVIDNVAQNQMWLTIMLIVINLGLSYLISLYVDNQMLNIIITIALMAVSLPTAARFSKRIKLDPKMDYEGCWQYEADFSVITNTDDQDDHLRVALDSLKDRFDNKT